MLSFYDPSIPSPLKGHFYLPSLPWGLCNIRKTCPSLRTLSPGHRRWTSRNENSSKRLTSTANIWHSRVVHSQIRRKSHQLEELHDRKRCLRRGIFVCHVFVIVNHAIRAVHRKYLWISQISLQNLNKVAFTFFHDHDWKPIESDFQKSRKSRHGQLWKSEQVWTRVAEPRSQPAADSLSTWENLCPSKSLSLSENIISGRAFLNHLTLADQISVRNRGISSALASQSSTLPPTLIMIPTANAKVIETWHVTSLLIEHRQA